MHFIYNITQYTEILTIPIFVTRAADLNIKLKSESFLSGFNLEDAYYKCEMRIHDGCICGCVGCLCVQWPTTRPQQNYCERIDVCDVFGGCDGRDRVASGFTTP